MNWRMLAVEAPAGAFTTIVVGVVDAIALPEPGPVAYVIFHANSIAAVAIRKSRPDLYDWVSRMLGLFTSEQ